MGVFKPGDGYIGKCRAKINSLNAVAIGIVYVILLIDNMLLTAVVPVLPEYFEEEEESSQSGSGSGSGEMEEEVTTTSFLNESSFGNTSCETPYKKHLLMTENLFIGILFASKPFIQCFANLAVGPLVDRIGFSLPILIGTTVMCVSALLFSFGTSYPVLLIARAIQGVGSASASVAGIAMLADRYSEADDEKRGKAIGIALGGLAMGVLIGPPYASAVYEIAGKETVFIILAIAAFLLAGVVLFVNGVDVEKRGQMKEPISIFKLLRDPYILLTATALLLGNFGIGVLEATLPLWMIETMCAAKWELGVAFLPISAAYLISVNSVAVFCQRFPRWFVAMLGLFIIGVGCAGVPFAKNLVGLIPPGAIHGCGIGLVDSSIFPMLAVLVDTRHRAVYGGVYAIADLSLCTSFVLGPLYAGASVSTLGFRWVMWGFAIAVVAFAPLLLFLRRLTAVPEETIPLIPHSDKQNDDVFTSANQNGSMVEREGETQESKQ